MQDNNLFCFLSNLFIKLKDNDILDELERMGVSVRAVNGKPLDSLMIITSVISNFSKMSAENKVRIVEILL